MWAWNVPNVGIGMFSPDWWPVCIVDCRRIVRGWCMLPLKCCTRSKAPTCAHKPSDTHRSKALGLAPPKSLSKLRTVRLVRWRIECDASHYPCVRADVCAGWPPRNEWCMGCGCLHVCVCACDICVLADWQWPLRNVQCVNEFMFVQSISSETALLPDRTSCGQWRKVICAGYFGCSLGERVVGMGAAFGRGYTGGTCVWLHVAHWMT